MKRHLLIYACCIAAVTAAAASRTATEAYVTNRVTQATNALHEAIAPTIDYSTNNVELTNTIAKVAPAPGNYDAVSNAAMSAAAATNDFLRLTGGTMSGNLFSIVSDIGVRDSVGGFLALRADAAGAFFWYRNGFYGADSPIYRIGLPDSAGTIALRSDLAAAADAATNYTDTALATADTTYRLTVGITNLNQSVQYVNTPASVTELAIQLPEGGGAKDWIVYVEAATNLTLTLPPATWWMADTAYTNDIPAATPTALYLTTVTTNTTPAIYMLSRQKLQPVTVTEIAP